jgi:peptidyl-prolyl cis-trans isomerase C/foldase protein PrsA
MKKSWILIFGILLALSIITSGCDKDKVENKVGEVNGQAISLYEYNAHLGFLQYYYEVQQGVQLDEKKDAKVLDALKNQAFDDLVLKQILWQQAEKENIFIEEKDIDEEINKAIETQGKESFEKVLEETGMSQNQLRDEIKTEKIYSELQNRVTEDVKINDEEIKQYYDDNSDLFKEESGMEIAHILVDTEDQAKEIIVMLGKGDNFAELAKEFSSCPSSAEGGNLGLINENSNYVPEFKEAALKLKAGEITKNPVKSAFGFHVIKAGEKREARIIPFEEIKTLLTSQLLENKKTEIYYNYLQDLHKKAEIKDLRDDTKGE